MDSRKLLEIFDKFQVEAIISEAPQTRLWYSQVATTAGWLIIEPKKATLFVDGRYFEYATKNAKNVKVELLKSDSLEQWLLNKNFNKIAIEADYLTVENKEKIKKLTNLSDASIINISGPKLRIVKTNEEIEKIQKAIDISLNALDKLKPFIVAGVSEKELQNKLEYLMDRLGADKESFESIVAFGENTAEPHHHSSQRLLQKGDMITIDFGAQYQGYAADITRTFIYDENSSTASTSKYQEILAIVEEAARLGRQAVRPGIKASEIDNICRTYISSKGYSNFFVHSTGHGLGIDVHEYPYVSPLSDIILEEGMVITVEPGIYLEGIGGARIEDDILVTANGFRNLSRKDENNKEI